MRLQLFILNPYDPPLIAPDRLTVPSLLRRHGYRTAGMGKWHLGWGVPMDRMSNVLLDRGLFTARLPAASTSTTVADLRHFPPYMYTEQDSFTGAPLRNATRRAQAGETAHRR